VPQHLLHLAFSYLGHDKNNQSLQSPNQTISAAINSLDKKLSNSLNNKISALTEKTTYEYQDLLRQYELGKKQAELISVRQDGLSELLDNIDAENQKAVEKLQRGLTQQDENLQAAQKQSRQISSQQQTEIDTLHSFDQKLAQNAQQLEQRTENLEQQEAQQQEKLVQLNTQSVLTTETSKKTQRQVDYVIQQEKSHFNLFSRSLIFVIIVIAVASIFGYQHFQKLSAMDTSLSKLAKQKPLGKPLEIKAVAIETQAQAALKQQLKSQVQQQQLLKQQQTTLLNDQVGYLKQQQLVQQQLTGLQQQLTAQQQKLQAKDEKIKLLSQEVQEVDDNLQLLNHSVGSYRGFNRSAEQGKLHSSLWLKQQPADNYTVQLLSVAQKAHIFQFIQRYGYHLNNNLAYFNVQADDSSQFVLTYGSFKEKAAAEQALEQLPGTVSHYNLGVAQIQSVQNLMQ